MSFEPVFELGLWNAWILMLYYPFHPLIMILIDKAVGTGEMTKKMGDVPYEKGERRIFVISIIVILVLFVRIPMKMDTDSNRWWALVPIDDGHLFQSMVISGTG